MKFIFSFIIAILFATNFSFSQSNVWQKNDRQNIMDE